MSQQIQNWLKESSQDYSRWLPIGTEELMAGIHSGIKSLGQVIIDLLKALLKGIPTVMLETFVLVLTVFFTLRDGPAAERFLSNSISFRARNIQVIEKAFYDSCYSAIVASILTGLLQALLVGIGALITHIPNIILVCFLTFIGSFLPMIGTTPIMVGILIYFAVKADYTSLVIFSVIATLVGISDNIARPFFLKGKTPIHAFPAFVFTFGAIAAVGFYGLFLGPVAAGVLTGMLQIFKPTERNT